MKLKYFLCPTIAIEIILNSSKKQESFLYKSSILLFLLNIFHILKIIAKLFPT